MRSTLIRLALAAVALLALSACSDVQDGVTKARDCTSLAEAVSRINLDPSADPQSIANDLEELNRRVDDLQNEDVKNAAGELRDQIQRFQEALRGADVADANEAIGSIRTAAENVARACNVPVDNILGGS